MHADHDNECIPMTTTAWIQTNDCIITTTNARMNSDDSDVVIQVDHAHMR